MYGIAWKENERYKVARTNYKFEKRKRELEKKRKKEEKAKRKRELLDSETDESDGSAAPESD